MRRARGGPIRSTHKSRTGAEVLVLDLCHPDSPFPPGEIVEQRNLLGEPVRRRTQRWGSVCATHDTCCPHERLEDARVSADDPADWCAGCRDADPSQADPATSGLTPRSGRPG